MGEFWGDAPPNYPALSNLNRYTNELRALLTDIQAALAALEARHDVTHARFFARGARERARDHPARQRLSWRDTFV
jgi:hypothetical protein